MAMAVAIPSAAVRPCIPGNCPFKCSADPWAEQGPWEKKGEKDKKNKKDASKGMDDYMLSSESDGDDDGYRDNGDDDNDDDDDDGEKLEKHRIAR